MAHHWQYLTAAPTKKTVEPLDVSDRAVRSIAQGRKPEGENMARQILKASTVIMLVIGSSLFAAAVTANGQTPDNRMTAVIPFDFTVGDKNLPSGKYTVRKLTSSSEGLVVTNMSTLKSAIRLTGEVSRNIHDSGSKMVFHRYGQNYFLAEVWYGGQTAGRALRTSNRERAIERELATTRSEGNSDLAANTYERVELVITNH